MAIRLTSNIIINPNNSYLPYRISNNKFANSVFTQVGGGGSVSLDTEVEGVNTGLQIRNFLGVTVAKLGDYDSSNNGLHLVIDDGSQKIEVNGNATGTGGVLMPSLNYLKITINGVDYKIALNT